MLVKFLRAVVGGFMRLLFSIQVVDKENMPKTGAVIVAMNHKSNWDGPLAFALLPRPLAIMAKKELFKFPVVRHVLKAVGAFPVSRGKNDIGAIKAALSALKAEKAMAIFPEGTRVKGDKPHVAKAGFVMLAEKTGAPIVPVSIVGKYIPFSGMKIIIGKPLYVKKGDGEKLSGDELQEISDYILTEILFTAGESNAPEKETMPWISR